MESKTGHLAQKTFLSHHPLVYYTVFSGPLRQQNNTTKTTGTPAKIRRRKEPSSEHPGASGWEKLQQQTSDSLLSGKELLFCHARVVTAGEMLQQQHPLLKAQHHFCFPGKAELSPDGARLLLRPHPRQKVCLRPASPQRVRGLASGSTAPSTGALLQSTTPRGSALGISKHEIISSLL